MKKLLLVPLIFLYCFVQGQNNQSLNPKVWLKADLLESNSNSWTDQSGNENDGAPFDTAIVKPSGLINFNKAVAFNGEDFKLNIPFNLSNTSQLTIVTVYNTSDESEERAIWSATINPNQDVSLSTQKLSSPESIAKYSDSNLNIPVVNTSSQYWGKAGEGVDGVSITLGALKTDTSSIASFSGAIAEFIVFDHLIGSAENQLLQSYLSLKYGTTFQLSDYISSAGTVIWDYQNNPDFSYAIAGLGRDDGFGLYQKQSSNVEEVLLTIGINEISKTNEDNPSVLKDKNFLAWGMNAEEPTPELSEEEIYPYKHPVMNRKWQMQVNGNDMVKLATSMQFDINDSRGESANCYLVIDRSGTGNFASETIEYIEPDSINTNGIAFFNNLVWDADNSGNDIFTLSFGMNNGVSCDHPICYNDATGTINMQIMGGGAPYSYSLMNDSISYSKVWSAESRFQSVENLAPGTYKLKVTDNGGNIATNTITITNPDEFTTGLDSTYNLKMGDYLNLDGGMNVSKLGTSFVWESDNGFYSTNSEVAINQPGEYKLTLINEKGCQATETIQVNPLNNILFNYKLYPNPSKGNYSLDIALAETSAIKVSIYNMHGAIVSRETRSGAAQYSFRGYLEESGLYFVEVETSFGKETFKLVVNN